MYRNLIKIGIARNNECPFGRSARIFKMSRQQYFEVWAIDKHECLAYGTLGDIDLWAGRNGFTLIATNKLGRTILF